MIANKLSQFQLRGQMGAIVGAIAGAFRSTPPPKTDFTTTGTADKETHVFETPLSVPQPFVAARRRRRTSAEAQLARRFENRKRKNRIRAVMQAASRRANRCH